VLWLIRISGIGIRVRREEYRALGRGAIGIGRVSECRMRIGMTPRRARQRDGPSSDRTNQHTSGATEKKNMIRRTLT
jgi:hypothetical protein